MNYVCVGANISFLGSFLGPMKASVYWSDNPVTLSIINPKEMGTSVRLAQVEASQLILFPVWPVTLKYKPEVLAGPLTRG